jgi:hypothetical protein
LSDLPAGTYTLAAGLYDAATFDRLDPVLAQTAPPEMIVDSGRVLIDTIEISGR